MQNNLKNFINSKKLLQNHPRPPSNLKNLHFHSKIHTFKPKKMIQFACRCSLFDDLISRFFVKYCLRPVEKLKSFEAIILIISISIISYYISHIFKHIRLADIS